MKLRLEPISAIIISILLGWGWHQATNKPVCYVHETIDNQTVVKPVLCEDIFTDDKEG